MLNQQIQLQESVKEPKEPKKANKHRNEAYIDFEKRITYKFLICEDASKFSNLINKFQMLQGNTSAFGIDSRQFCAYCCCYFIYPTFKWFMTSNFEVPANHFALVDSQTDGLRRTEIYGPGYHNLSFYKTLIGVYTFSQRYKNNLISSPIGDLMIAEVDQGTIMHLEQGGQNIILGPGIHKITEPLQFMKIISLDNFYIEIGPEKWITVPDGYDGIAVNRGQIRILEGGKQHHLPHVGDQFAKIVPKTLQTDKIPTDILQYIQKLNNDEQLQFQPTKNQQVLFTQDKDPSQYLVTSTAEGSMVILEIMIFWRIVNSEIAAKQAIEILQQNQNNNFVQQNQQNNQRKNQQNNQRQQQNQQNQIQDQQSENYHIKMASNNISNLRLTILRIAKNHLTAAVGRLQLAGQTLTAQVQQEATQNQNKQQQRNTFEILQTIQSQQLNLKTMINKDLLSVGCQLENICIYSITPTNDIQQELDKQTKAKVDANTEIIKATSNYKAQEITNQMESMINLQQAKIDGDTNYLLTVRQAESNVQASMGQVQAIKIKAQGEADSELIQANILANSQIERSKGQVESMKLLAKGESDSQQLRVVGEKQSAIIVAQGQAEAIKKIGTARLEESNLLSCSDFSQQLAKVRVTGEVGEKIFSGDNNNFVFGQNPGDLIYNMLSQFTPDNKQKLLQ